jgi:Ca2+-dependent lipid-binding protein
MFNFIPCGSETSNYTAEGKPNAALVQRQKKAAVASTVGKWKAFKGSLVVHAVCGRDLLIADSSTSDPFCKMTFMGTKVQTKKIKSTLDPNWKEMFTLPVNINTSVISHSNSVN